MARLNQINGSSIRHEYDSIEELADVAKPYVSERFPEGMRQRLDDTHYYGSTGTPGAAFVLARDGWDEHLEDTLTLAREAVETVEREHEALTFQPHHDVSGGMVDMAAFLSGEPECMIDFPPAKTSRVGRVITLCASISASAAVSADSLILKGQVITALAMELERMGMNVELYADQSVKTYGGYSMTQRVLVKGPNDVLDPARILFAYAHPAMLRVLALTAYHQMDDRWLERMGGHRTGGGGYGSPAAPPQDLTEGTIYLPETYSGTDVDAAAILRKHLTDLNLI